MLNSYIAKHIFVQNSFLIVLVLKAIQFNIQLKFHTILNSLLCNLLVAIFVITKLPSPPSKVLLKNSLDTGYVSQVLAAYNRQNRNVVRPWLHLINFREFHFSSFQTNPKLGLHFKLH